MSLLKKFVAYYRPHRKLFIIDMTCAFIMAALDLTFPLISKNFINDYIPNGNLTKILIFSGILLGMYLIRMLATYIVNYWGHVVGTNMEADMRRDLFRHLQTLPFTYYDENKTGVIMSRLVGDLRDVSELAHHGPEDLFLSSVMILGTFIALLLTNWVLTLLAFFFVGLLILYAIRKRVKMLNAFRAVRKGHAEINARLESSISGIRLCKSFANENFEIEQFEYRNRSYRDSYRTAYKVMAEYSAYTNLFTDILNLVVLSAGGYLVVQSLTGGIYAMDYGEFVSFLLYMSFMVAPIRRLISFTQQFQSGTAGFERFIEIMDIKSDIIDAPDAKELVNPKGAIRFQDVTFSYGNNQTPVLEHFNLEMVEGRTIALVGPSGVGKTTISHLIPRFYNVNSGEILLDNKNIADYKLESLRKHIGFVQQDVFIFYGTIRDNILYGAPDASDEEIFAAAKKAKIHKFIMTLPDGYGSIVGERGVKLSGGQKQRVSLARVFLKNPPIIILDEATSSLDNATELAIQESIELLAKNRTTLIVAHRLSTIKNADEILVLTDEGIAERGTHEELLNQKQIYAKLFEAQFKGFIPDEVE